VEIAIQPLLNHHFFAAQRDVSVPELGRTRGKLTATVPCHAIFHPASKVSAFLRPLAVERDDVGEGGFATLELPEEAADDQAAVLQGGVADAPPAIRRIGYSQNSTSLRG
jgi:hypothetical protein